MLMFVHASLLYECDPINSNFLARAHVLGLVGGVDITATVYPFLLRGVTLAGIDSAACPGSLRTRLWERLADSWALEGLDEITHEVTLDQLEESIALMRDGDHVGRTIVRLGNND